MSRLALLGVRVLDVDHEIWLTFEPLFDSVVRVRHRRDSDVAAIAAVGHDPEVERWLDDPPTRAAPSTPSEIAEIWRSGQGAPLLIASADTDEPVGLINLQFSNDEQATVAYRVFPQWRGRGYAVHALALVTDWALGGLGLEAVLLEIKAANVPSVKVAEKCGFTRRATIPNASSDPDQSKITFIRQR